MESLENDPVEQQSFRAAMAAMGYETTNKESESPDEQLLGVVRSQRWVHFRWDSVAQNSLSNVERALRNLSTMECLLRGGANPNARDSRGKTCLNLIVEHRREHKLCQVYYDKTVDVLLTAGASPYILDDEKSTPLLIKLVGTERCSENLLAIEELILDGVDVNETDWRGCTSLHHAARLGEAEIVSILLSAGASPHSTDIVLVNTPLLETMSVEGLTQHQRIKIAQQLIACGADINATNRNRETSLHLACKRGEEESVEWLLSNGAALDAVTKDGYNALLIAAASRKLEVVRQLISSGEDVNFVNEIGINGDPSKPLTALHIAVMNDDVDMLRYLLDCGADPNRTNDLGESLLYFTLKKRPKELLGILEQLLRHGADMLNSGLDIPETPIEFLIYDARLAEIRLLLEHGLDLDRYNHQNSSDFLPLHAAIIFGSGEEMLALLLKHAKRDIFNFNHEDADGYSPLFIAIKQKLPGCVELLLDSGADVNHVNKHNRTPLEFATLHYQFRCQSDTKHYEVIQLLVESGASIRNILGEIVPNDLIDQISDESDEELAEPANDYQPGYDFWIDPGAYRYRIRDARNHFETAKCIVKSRALYESRCSPVEEPMELGNMGGSVKLRSYYEACRNEIISLRESPYYNSISYLDVLTADKNSYKRVRDDGFYVKFEEENLENHFPIYANDLRKRLRKKRGMHELWEKAVKKLSQCLFSLLDLTEIFDPDAYYFIVFDILNHLHHDDLVSIAKM